VRYCRGVHLAATKNNVRVRTYLHHPAKVAAVFSTNC